MIYCTRAFGIYKFRDNVPTSKSVYCIKNFTLNDFTLLSMYNVSNLSPTLYLQSHLAKLTPTQRTVQVLPFTLIKPFSALSFSINTSIAYECMYPLTRCLVEL